MYVVQSSALGSEGAMEALRALPATSNGSSQLQPRAFGFCSGYNYSPGNLGALLGGQRGRGFGGRGFGGRGFGWVLARNYGF